MTVILWNDDPEPPASGGPAIEIRSQINASDFAEIAATIDRTRGELLAIHDRLAVRWPRPSEVTR
jgi:hypothetical protein